MRTAGFRSDGFRRFLLQVFLLHNIFEDHQRRVIIHEIALVAGIVQVFDQRRFGMELQASPGALFHRKAGFRQIYLKIEPN